MFINRLQLINVLILVQFCFAQENWQYSIDSDLTIALNTFSSNWKSKDAGSLVWVSKMNAIAKKHLFDKAVSETTLKLIYGQTKLQDKTTKRWSSPEKSSDDIQMQSILRFDIGKFIDPFISASINSQFVDNRKDQYKCYFNPVEFTESFGFARDLIKNGNLVWTSRFGCAVRQSVDRDYPQSGDSAGQIIYVLDIIKDGGSELVSEFKYNRPSLFSIVNKLRIYTAFISTESVKMAENDYWRYPDITFETSISLFLTRNLIMSYYYNLIFDREFDKEPRSRQTLGAGFKFGFVSKK